MSGGLPIDTEDLLKASFATGRSYFRAGGLRRIVKSFFTFLGVDNNGRLSKTELESFYNAFSSPSIFSELPSVFFRMFDGNSDGFIHEADVVKSVNKVVDLVFSLLSLAVLTTKQMSLAIVLPVVNGAFALKSGMFGGAPDSCTKEEIQRLLDAPAS